MEIRNTARKKLSKAGLKTLPYAACVAAFLLFFFSGKLLNTDLRGLAHGIAGSFLAIPILYLIYEMSKAYSQRRLNVKLVRYAKLQIDGDVFQIIGQLSKVTRSYDSEPRTYAKEVEFLSESKENLANRLVKCEYLGFQVFKNWSISETHISEILKNPYFLKHMDNDMQEALIDLMTSLRHFPASSAKLKGVFVPTGNTAQGYSIKHGMELGSRNSLYPDLYLLVKDLPEDRFLVVDHGDFEPFEV